MQKGTNVSNPTQKTKEHAKAIKISDANRESKERQKMVHRFFKFKTRVYIGFSSKIYSFSSKIYSFSSKI
jgi:hypothetical protein